MSAWWAVWFVGVALGGLVSSGIAAVEASLSALGEEERKGLMRRLAASGCRMDWMLEHPLATRQALALAGGAAKMLLLVLGIPFLYWFARSGGVSEWVLVGVLLVSALVLIDVVPGLVASRIPVVVFVGLLRPAAVCVRLFARPAGMLNRVVEAVIERVRVRATPEESAVRTRREILDMVGCAVQERVLSHVEGRLIAECVKLGGEKASHCMTPRVETFGIPDNLDNGRACELLRSRRYHRVPVYGSTPDDVLGVLDVPSFLRNPSGHYTGRLQPPAFVPATMDALLLLRSLLMRNQRFAILLDEYGGIKGIVTLSDLLEELLGMEGPDSSTGLYLEKIREGFLLAAGHARLDDLCEMTGISLPAHVADTVGGLLAEMHGSIPRPGTSFEIGEWRVVVRRASRMRVKEVRIERGGSDTVC